MLGVLWLGFVLFSLTATFWISFIEKGYGAEMMAGELILGVIITILFLLSLLGIIGSIYDENERRKRKGRECRVIYLEGLPDFELEQRLCLTLDVQNRVILIDGLKELDAHSKDQSLKRVSGLKDTQVRLRFQQVTKLNYIYWEGEISRWVSGSSGFSYPGLFKGTRVYVPPTSGYFKKEKIKVDGALEIQYQDQKGFPEHIVLKGGRNDDYVEKWLESLCRCTRIPAPQYIPPIKPAKPGPKYL